MKMNLFFAASFSALVAMAVTRVEATSPNYYVTGSSARLPATDPGYPVFETIQAQGTTNGLMSVADSEAGGTNCPGCTNPACGCGKNLFGKSRCCGADVEASQSGQCYDDVSTDYSKTGYKCAPCADCVPEGITTYAPVFDTAQAQGDVNGLISVAESESGGTNCPGCTNPACGCGKNIFGESRCCGADIEASQSGQCYDDVSTDYSKTGYKCAPCADCVPEGKAAPLVDASSNTGTYDSNEPLYKPWWAPANGYNNVYEKPNCPGCTLGACGCGFDILGENRCCSASVELTSSGWCGDYKSTPGWLWYHCSACATCLPEPLDGNVYKFFDTAQAQGDVNGLMSVADSEAGGTNCRGCTNPSCGCGRNTFLGKSRCCGAAVESTNSGQCYDDVSTNSGPTGYKCAPCADCLPEPMHVLSMPTFPTAAAMAATDTREEIPSGGGSKLSLPIAAIVVVGFVAVAAIVVVAIAAFRRRVVLPTTAVMDVAQG